MWCCVVVIGVAVLVVWLVVVGGFWSSCACVHDVGGGGWLWLSFGNWEYDLLLLFFDFVLLPSLFTLSF